MVFILKFEKTTQQNDRLKAKTSLMICLTHNSTITCKKADRASRTTTALGIKYDVEKKRYTIGHYRHRDIKALPEILKGAFTSTELVFKLQAFMSTLNVDPAEKLLCLDGNLTNPAGERLTTAFRAWITEIKPSRLVVFSQTEACVDIAESYCSNYAKEKGVHQARAIAASDLLDALKPSDTRNIGFFGKRKAPGYQAEGPKETEELTKK